AMRSAPAPLAAALLVALLPGPPTACGDDPQTCEVPFRVPPGFVVERVAGLPVVDYPLVAGFYDRGRLFVAHPAVRNVNFRDEGGARLDVGQLEALTWALGKVGSPDVPRLLTAFEGSRVDDPGTRRDSYHIGPLTHFGVGI